MKSKSYKLFLLTIVLLLFLLPISSALANAVVNNTNPAPEIYGVKLLSRTMIPGPTPGDPPTEIPILGAVINVYRTHTIDAYGQAQPVTPHKELLGVITIEDLADPLYNGFRTDLPGIYSFEPQSPAPGYLLPRAFTVEFPRMVCNDDTTPVNPEDCQSGYVVAPNEDQFIEVLLKQEKILGSVVLHKTDYKYVHMSPSANGGQIEGGQTPQGGNIIHGDNPVAGAVFELWQMSSYILADNPADYPKFLGFHTTLADGTLTVGNLTVGEYRFHERSVPAPYVLNPDPIWFVILGHSDTNQPTEPEEVWFENTVPPSIDKDVMYEADDHWEVNKGTSYDYHITLPIPQNIYRYSKFDVYDILDSRISLNGSCADAVSLSANFVGTVTCTIIPAVPGAADEQGDRVRIDVVGDVSKFNYEDLPDLTGNFVITVKAYINDTYDRSNPREGDEGYNEDDPATWNGYIPNRATLVYNDSIYPVPPRVGDPGNPGTGVPPANPPTIPDYNNPPADDDPITTPPVWVKPLIGSIQLTKTDSGTTPLQGASFQLFTDVSCTTAFVRPGMTAPAGEVVATSDANGLVLFDQLPMGTYYFKEIAAPAEYRLVNNCFGAYVLSEASPVVTGLSMKNHKISEQLPDTGTLGAVLFLGGGALLIGVAFLALRRKKTVLA